MLFRSLTLNLTREDRKQIREEIAAYLEGSEETKLPGWFPLKPEDGFNLVDEPKLLDGENNES